MKFVSVLINQPYSLVSDKMRFCKVSLYGLCLLGTVLLSPFMVMAKTGTYNGSVPSGWFFDNGVYTFQKSLHAGNGFTSGNTLKITGGNLTPGGVSGNKGSAFGGWSQNGNADKNTVEISGGTVNRLFAGWTSTGNVTGNTIKASGGTVLGSSFAGSTDSGNAIGNTFYVSGTSDFQRYTFAGRSHSGNAINNTFYMNGGHVQFIGGGRSNSGKVLNNSVFITAGSVGIAAAARSNGTAHLEGNQISISGGTINSYTTGAYAEQGTSVGNKVSISGGTFKGNIYGADSGSSGTHTKNTVYITSGTTSPVLGGTQIYGAISKTGAVTGNLVDIRGIVDIKNNTVSGGYSESGNVQGNSVVIEGATNSTLAGAKIYGGHTLTGTTSGNSVYINTTGNLLGTEISGANATINAVSNNSVTIDNVISAGSISGASATLGDIDNSKVTINGGTFTGIIAGARSTSGNLDSNSVIINGGNFTGSITAASTSGSIKNSSINIKAGTFADSITGAVSTAGNIDSSAVTISGGNFTGAIVGASTSKDITNSKVTISGGTFADSITAANSSTGTIKDSSVTIQNGTFGGSITGARSTSSAIDSSSVTISGGNFTGDIAGANTTSGTISNNTVAITGGVFSGRASISGGNSVSGTVRDNTVTISGGTFNGEKISGGHSESGSVTNNHVIITGGTFLAGSTITGGSVKDSSGSVSGNTITIDHSTSHLDMSGASVHGGVLDTTSRAISPTHNPSLRNNNTLILKTNTNVTSVTNFENYEFHMADSHDVNPMLSATNLHLGTDANLRVYLGNKADDLNVGDKINLFRQTGTGGIIDGNVKDAIALQGLSVINHLSYSGIGTGTHFFTIASQSAHPHSITFSEARLASFSFMNKSTDLIVGQGIASALEAASANPNNWEAFSAVSVGTSKYDTSSGTTTGSVEFGGLSFIAGASKTTMLGSAELLAGAYIEAGTGFIDTHNNNINRSAVDTSGDTGYYGLGLLGRYGMDNGLYGEVFMRAGMLDSDNYTADNRYQVDYDTNSTYYGAGLSFGYEVSLFQNRDNIDLYGRYVWTHLTEQDEYLDSKNYKFDAINSQQVRVGVQYNFMHDGLFTPFIGIAGQYELDGEAGATIQRTIKTLRPDITGFTGLAELGVRVLPSENSPVSVSMNFEAYVGEREGVSLALDFGYAF